MKLEDFIAESLKEIINGVVAGQEHAVQHNAKVNPPVAFYRDQGLVLADGETGCKLTEVEFDVAVTATEGKSKKGGIGVFVGSVGIGSASKSETEHESVSRLKFTVPVSLPPGAERKKAKKPQVSVRSL